MATAVETGLNEYLSTTAKLKIGSLFGYIGVGDENKMLVVQDVGAKTAFTTSKQEEKYACFSKNILNTHALPYAFTLGATKPDNKTNPELALMFIKTYMKQLIPYGYIEGSELYKVFNRNQELIEIPYAVALYLGGLYYFSVTDNSLSGINGGDLFSTINNIAGKSNFTVATNDVYDSASLNRMALTYNTDVNTGIGQNGTTTDIFERLYAPSMMVLNRSLYDLHGEDRAVFSEYYTIKTNANGERSSEEIPVKLIMPSVGFGIQNKFLNHYNKMMFGDYLNGTTDLLENNIPHSVIGAYCGISKPIKTYNSYDLEFTAFYRNLHVGSVNYKVDDLVTELDTATKNIKSDYTGTHPFGSSATVVQDNTPSKYVDEEKYAAVPDATYVYTPVRPELQSKSDPADDFLSYNFPKKEIIQSFVTYSKLKALYLSNNIPDKTELKSAITKLCSVKNIKSVFNADKKNKGEYEISDFYFLVSHVFFASYKKLALNHNTPNGGNYYDISARLNFGMGDEFNGVYTYRGYQFYCLPKTLDNILNPKINSVDDEINALTDFLSYVWTLERINLKPEFSKVGADGKLNAVYALYPSCGGGITPLSLIRSGDINLDVRFNNYVDNRYGSGTNGENIGLHTLLYKDPKKDNTRPHLNVGKEPGTLGDGMVGGAPMYFVGGGKGYGEGPRSTITSFIDEDSVNKFEKLLKENNVSRYNKDFMFADNPVAEKYFIDSNFDTNSFLSIGFDNNIVLKNTTRFFWFDPTNYGDDIKHEYKVDDDLQATIPDLTLELGVDAMFKSPRFKDYFTLNNTSVFDIGVYQKLKDKLYLEQFTLNNLMDSLDFEKLETFKEMFIDFANIKGKSKSTYGESAHNLRSLVLSSSCVTAQDITQVSAAGKTWSSEEINLMLIGNSMFQYEFFAEIGISNIVNYALSSAQYKVTNSVIDEFCTSMITVANFSPNTPISHDGKTESSLHKVIGLPEILFSNRETYDDILTLLEKTTESDKEGMGIYFTRKILFGDQYIEPFTALSAKDKIELEGLTYTYLINKLHTRDKFDGELKDLYISIVETFFQTINVKYTYNRFKQLNRLIRTYTYRILKNNEILNEKALSNNTKIIDFAQFKTDFNIT